MRQLRYTTGEMRLKAFTTPVLVGLALALVAAPARAHHSFAMFDSSKVWTWEGTVVEFQWRQPHSHVIVDVPKRSTGTGGQIAAGSPVRPTSRG